MPRVSVILPAYNAADTIGQALESAFAQSFTDYEVIVIDDGSTDRLEAAIAPYRDRVRLIRQRNRRISGAKNAGAAQACGEYLAFLDADDIWMPERLARTVAVLEADPRCVLVSCGAATIDKDGTPSAEYSIGRSANLTPGLAEIVSGQAQIKVSSILIRRAIFERIGGFDEAAFGRLRGGEDLYLYALAREHGTIRLVPEALMKYRAGLMRNRMWRYERGRRILIRKWRRRYGGKINIRACDPDPDVGADVESNRDRGDRAREPQDGARRVSGCAAPATVELAGESADAADLSSAANSGADGRAAG